MRCEREGTVWGNWGMRVTGVLDVVGARPGGGAAANRLRVATTPLLSLAIFQQRHLRKQSEDRCHNNDRSHMCNFMTFTLMLCCSITSYQRN